jgi:tetratricopeptide (TPR) repeat protein
MKNPVLWLPLQLLALLASLCAQDAADGEAALQKLRDLLRNQPMHAGLFDRYFKSLVQRNAVDDEVRALESKVGKDSGDVAATIVLGRVLLRAGKEERALDVLEAIPNKSEDVQQALGDIYQKLARFDAAVRAFEASLPAARTTEQKRALFEKIGKAQLALGKKAAAIATWRRMAELDGGKLVMRLRFAELLAEAGLVAEAAHEYVPLLAETEGDPAQHCRVLRDHGRLLELQGDLDAALRTYDRILALTARGNWLRKEVEARIVAIHRRTGKVEALLTRLRQQVGESPDDLAASELLADVLVEMRDTAGAVQALQRIAPRFPKDVRLARRLAELHVERGDTAAAIAEYQRILTEKPDEMELYLELGTLFARGEQFAEAKNQWEKALARNLKDASLCTRIAAMYALWQRNEDAVRLYERALELEPDVMTRWVDLAEFQFTIGEGAAATATLDRAIGRSQGRPRSLETLVGVLREHGLHERARQCLEAIIAAEPDNHDSRYALAELLLAQGEQPAAVGLLWQIVEGRNAETQRAIAANALVAIAAREGRLEQLIAQAAERQTSGAAFLAGRAFVRGREFDRAIEAFRTALQRKPEDLESRQMLARLLAEEGRVPDALAEYERIGMIAPAERKRQFRDVARLHLESYDLDAAIDTWQRAMRDNPDNAAVFVEVGKEFLEMQRVHEALEAFQQAARLRSKDVDIQLRLASALQQAGRADEAERQLLQVATEASEAKDRAEARAQLFRLYGEQGTIEKRIDALQATVAENPYDKHAPHLLADLYMRVGDLVLGLDAVERALQFQPRNRELGMRRAELLESLEEWDKARAAHEALLKFPDADRDLHLFGIAQAEFEGGRPEQAKAWVQKLRDDELVVKLFDKYDLHDEAIAFHQRRIARSPNDVRAYLQLATGLHKLGRVDEAIPVLERLLNLRPFHRQALELAGKLYVQAGRRADAVAAGLRLFGLRGEETEKTRAEERQEQEAQERSRRYGWYYQRSFSQQRLEAAQTYFRERGLDAEWGRILVAEARRRPTDELLFENVRGYFQWQEKSAARFVQFVGELLAQDFSKAPIPPGKTVRGYRQSLETAIVQVWTQDASVAEQRLAVLAGDGRSVAELVERGKVADALGKLDLVEQSLAAALERQPDEPLALALLAESHISKKRFAEAAGLLQRLAQWWLGPGQQWEAELEQRSVEQWKLRKKAILDGLPRRIRRRVSDAQLASVRQETRSDAWVKPACYSFPEAVPSLLATLGKLIRVQRANNDEAGLQKTVQLAVSRCKTLADFSQVGGVLFQEGCRLEARELLERVLQRAAQIKADPEQIYFWPHYAAVVQGAAGPLGELYAAAGEHERAYHVLRENGHGERAELVLRESGKVEAIVAGLRSEIDRRGNALREARARGAADLRSLELDYRDAVIKLADFLIGEKCWQEAEDTYVASLPMLADELQVRDVVAQLRLRRGAWQQAIAMYEEIIETKRRRRRAEAGETAAPPTRLSPTLPGRSTDTSAGGAAMVSYGPGGYGVRYYGRGIGRQLEVSDEYLKILGVHRDRSDHAAMFAALKKIMQEDPATFRQMSWQVLDTLRNVDLGKQKLPVLRILKDVVQNDDWLTLEYAKACREEEELKEARRTLEKFVARRGSTDEYYLQQGEKELDAVLQKLGEHKTSIADLRATVGKEPDNVRHRMRLAERLKKEHDYRGALEQVRAVVAKAPYLKRAKEMVVETAAACGDEATAIAMQRRLYDEATDPNDKVRRGVGLANWLAAAGQEAEAVALVDALETKSGGSDDFSPGNWFIDKGLVEKALQHYRAEHDRLQSQAWRQDTLRQRIARLELSLGQGDAALDRMLQAIEAAGSLTDREQRFKQLLTLCKGHPRPEELREQVQRRHGERKTVADLLALASASFACGDPDAAEAELRVAVQRSSKEVYLFPLLIGLRRLHDDFDGALAVLDQMGQVYGGSESMRWTGETSVSERDRQKIERARILTLAGRDAEAVTLLESIADDTRPHTMMTVSRLFRERRDVERALEWRRRYTAKIGTRDRQSLLEEARLLLDLGREAEAMDVVRQAWLMARNDQEVRNLLVQLHRKAGTLAAFVQELETEYQKDIRDADLRAALLGLYEELRQPERRRQVYDAMLAHEDLVDEALSGLTAMATEAGDDQQALALRSRQLARKGGDEKRKLHQQIGELQLRLGERDAAVQSMRKGFDVDTVAGLAQLGHWLRGHDLKAASLEVYQQILALDPNHENAHLHLAEAAWEQKRWADAVAAGLEHLRRRRGHATLYESGSLHTILLDAVAGLDEATRKTWLSTDGDGPTCERAAVLLLARAEFEAAAAAARRALEQDNELVQPRVVLVAALRALQRPAELETAVGELRERIEREYVATADWQLYQEATELQNELGRLRHLRGDDAGATRAWRDPAVRRTPYSNPFGYWRDDWGVRYAAEQWIGVRQPEQALQALALEFLQRERAPWQTYLQALARSGRTAQVEAFAWKRLLDPLELYGVQSGSYGWIWDGGEYRQAQGMQEVLVDLYRRSGRFDELRPKAEALRARPASRRQADDLIETIARMSDDPRVRAERRQQRLDELKDQATPEERFQVAQLWSEAGDVERAIGLLRELLDFESEGLLGLAKARPTGGYSRRSSRRGDQSPFSFSFSGDDGSSWWYYGWSRERDQQRMLGASLLLRSAQAARAHAVERDLLKVHPLQRRLGVAHQIMNVYLTHHVPADAARIAEQMLSQHEKELKPAERDHLLQSLASAREREGDETKARAARVALCTSLEQRIAAAPGAHAFALRRMLAGERIVLGDAEAALREIDGWLLRFAPDDHGHLALRAQALRRKGDAQAAVTAWRELSERKRRSGQDDAAADEAELGLALRQAGAEDEARTWLQSALPKLGRYGPLVREVRQALEAPRK